MLPIALRIEYEGTKYCGWQKQRNGPSIQETLENLIEKLSGKRSVVYGSGRTDSGVHARGQVAHFLTHEDWTEKRWLGALNFYLPPDIRILEGKRMSPGFHAQKRALGKVYEYTILNQLIASAMGKNYWHVTKPLDWEKIEAAAQLLVGKKDFKAFCGARSTVKTTTRELWRVAINHHGGGLYVLRFEGSGFLKQMVRIMVGTLIQIGRGKKTEENIKQAFKTGARNCLGPTAPPEGLCLVKVLYDACWELG